MTDGLGPDLFDCSGLVLRSMRDVLGEAACPKAIEFRHVRDFWRAASGGDDRLHVAKLAIGNLVVTRRHYTIDGKLTAVPGHIGIVTHLDTMPSLIHASPRSGYVEERPLRALDTLLGCIAIQLTS